MVTENKRIYTGTKQGIGIQRMSGSAQKASQNTKATIADTIGAYDTYITEQFNFKDIKSKNSTNFLERDTPPIKNTKAPVKNTESNWEDTTYNLLREVEGFESNAYLDKSISGTKDGFRVGFGSGTVTKGNNITNVTSDSTVTRAEAEADLKRRVIEEFGPRAKSQSGSAWDTFSNNSKAAITSIVYNAGRIPKNIREAIKTGDNATIAAAIKANGVGNKLTSRRTREATLFLSPDTKTSFVQRRKI